MSAPLCPVCARRLPKLTCTVWVDQPEATAYPDNNWSRHIRPVTPPRSIADCRKLTNQQVVSVTYHYDQGSHGGEVRRFSEWDGKSYWTASRPFCKPECALAFARASYNAGYRLNKTQLA